MLRLKTPVTHGRMYQIWKIVSGLRIIFFMREHNCSVHNILVVSATDVLCLQTLYEKIKLLEFSIIVIRIVLTAPVDHPGHP